MLINSTTHLCSSLNSSNLKSAYNVFGHNNTYFSCPNFTGNFGYNSISIIQRPIAIDIRICCRARRRVRYEDNDEDEDSYGYNEEIGLLEMYSQSSRDEALLVTAILDDQLVEIVIFKGFSSCLNYQTSSDPTKSVVPQRARIKTIDRIKGPLNPTNIEYIEKGLTWETFLSRIRSN
ncbi:uncharacterized protein LOC130810190 [Amaranthus tricolor]|uniref:uncharacterized protein LOC130810190 n=1 Tax=Amaranthus tricolor TaxID=29722 RepID=UPI0025843874|nr:uncharacterized protein LOC130810190 [Amaranthus tricolor]